MKRYLAGITLLLTTVSPFTGCNSTPPVTDCASFIENLEYAGATVNVTGSDEHAKPLAGQYADFYRSALDTALEGATIDPAFLEATDSHLQQIEEQVAAMEFSSTLLDVNGGKVNVYEYPDAEAAAWDAGYIDYPKLDITIPTDKGDLNIVVSTLGIKMYAYKTDRIIVQHYPKRNDEEGVSELLESLLGPPFYEY